MKRTESDFLGEKEIDDNSYYGIQTARAMENFTSIELKIDKIMPELIESFALIKKSVCRANYELGMLSKEKFEVIEYACTELESGKYNSEFVLEPLQGGAGTSTNMNVNEVITNIALLKMGYKKGDYNKLDPNDDVNKSQSTNDTYPSSIKVAIFKLIDKLSKELENTITCFQDKAKSFKGIYKVGRTQMQDAVPMTLGHSFMAFADSIKDGLSDLNNAKSEMAILNLGATAIGSGILTHPDYKTVIEKKIKECISNEFTISYDLFKGTSDVSPFLRVSSALRRICMQLVKIANDLILMSSGPRSGLNEIFLPQTQAGSSIMPGKINPVMPEFINQICFKIIGDDVANTMACSFTQLELNAYEPLLAYNLITDIKSLRLALIKFREKCLLGILANEEGCKRELLESFSLATLLNLKIGYKKASEIVKYSEKHKITLEEALVQKEHMTIQEARELLRVENAIAEFSKLI